MKRTLLFTVSVIAVMALSAQRYQISNNIQHNAQPERYVVEPQITRTAPAANFVTPQKPEATAGDRDIVTVITIGAAGNAYGMFGNGRTYLWADNNLNSVVFSHRMTVPPGSGFLAYDLSNDGGMTWNNNIQVYDATLCGNARYPQGGIYNPAGNTDPNNAFYTFAAPLLSGGNGPDWGGLAVGTHKLDQSMVPNVTCLQTNPPYYHLIPNAMTINPANGDVFVVEDAYDLAASQYTDNLHVVHGVFNSETNHYDYNRFLIPFPAVPGAQAWPVDYKIAFAPDGMIGYIALIFDNHLDPFAAGYGLYPIVMKTTDGGLTWGDPTAIIMSGPDGFDEVKYYLTDEQWEDLWVPPAPHRDSVLYQTAFELDLAVDMNGNPYIGTTIGVASVTTPYSIIAQGGFGATFMFYSTNQGDTWKAQYVTHNKTFRGTFGEISEDSRTQVIVTQDGSKVFLSWLDTDFEGVDDNIMPDIHAWGFDVMTRKYTEVYNVTYLSEGWLESYMGSASHYAFTNGDTYTIPLVYQTIPGGDPLNPVDFKYIVDFTINDEDFIYGPDDPGTPGDANGDGTVNVSDVVITISYILGNNPPNFVFENGDVNGDGVINVSDVVGIVNIILGGK